MTTIRQACEAVVNASPSDYEAACEVWTRVCTPQAVLAALDAAAANEAALREAGNYLLEGERLGRVRLTVTYSHDDIDYIRNLEAALATPPSAAAERVQRVVAAAERICEADKRGDAAMKSRDYGAADASFDALSEAMSDLHAALDGGKEAQ